MAQKALSVEIEGVCLVFVILYGYIRLFFKRLAMKRILPLLFLAIFFNTHRLTAQCSMVPVDLQTRVSNSSLVAEGKVLAKRSFLNTAGNYIYTSNLVEVYNVFKGNIISTKIEVITEGGEIGTRKQSVDPSLQLDIGDMGVFTLYTNNLVSQFGFGTYTAYADMQGFIKYDVVDHSAAEPFAKYNNIQTDVYGALQALTNVKLKPSAISGSANKTAPSSVAAIAAFMPTSITAGTATSLTITGNGFGATKGTSIVEFKNADDGGATYIQPHASQYVSWSNNQIVVQVPSRTTSGTVTTSGTAGTGVIRVTTASGSTVSAQTLTVNYGHLNVYYSNTLTPTQIFNTRHVNLNTMGGMTWQMYTGFDANASAKASFQRAFQTWRCATYINWVLGATVSTNTIVLDGVNVIRFDIGSELPAGVLGRCTSYFSGCVVGSVVSFYVSELDICFDDATNWQYGPAAPTGTQYDFESVAVHELGHGHQLTHVINNADVMHYSISNAVSKRVLNTDDINGGNAVMTRNLSGGVCGKGTMSALNSTNCAVGSPTAAFTINPSTVCVGQTVNFTDNSTGSPSAWSWTITGGSPATSTVQNPSATYASPGIYSVTLVSSNGFGTSSPLTKTLSVLAAPSLTAISATSPICAGASATLMASGSGVTGYTWNPGGLIGGTVTATPSVSTIYTVSFSNGTCSNSATVSVVVTPNPTVSVNSATACNGQTATLTASGATTYTWMPGSLTGSVQAFTPSATTVYTVTGANGSCTNVKTATITILATPTLVVSGSSVICSGNSTTLTVSGGTSYTWMPGSLTGSVQIVSPSSNTVYSVTGTNGSCMSIRNYTVVVNPTPTITVNSASICSGQSATLTASGAANYTWMPGSLTGSTQVLSPSSTTIYTLTGSSGLCSSTRTTNITVTTTPTVSVAGTSVICSGNSTTLSATGAASYTWNPGALTGSVQILSPAASTVYTITGANGLCTTSKNFTVVVSPTPTITVNSATVCAGSSATLTANGATSYTWNPGALTGSVQVLSPASTTIYTITGVTGLCSSTKTTNITVNTTPTVSISGSSVICSGNSATLTAGGAASYTWNPGALTGSVQVVSPATTAVYTVTGANGSCTSVKSFTLVVNTTPTITVSSATICSGGSATLTAGGAANYTWMPGSLTGSAQVLSPSSTTIYTITGTNGTCSSTRTTAITVSGTPTLNVSGGPVCSGNSATLTANGATAYTWNPGALTGSAQVVSPSSTTVYSVTGANGTCTSNINYTLTVQTSPTLNAVANPSVICVTQAATLSATGASGYLWYPGPVSGNPIVVSPAASMVYTVQGNIGSCLSSKTVALTVSTCAGINSVSQNGAVKIYPNPSQGIITIETGGIFSGKISLYNTIGQEIHHKNVREIEVLSFDLGPYANGIYFVKLQPENGHEKVFRVLKD
jgi:PKD repeat protein